MDQLPWPSIVGYGSGWVAFGVLAMLMARKVANGDWVPRSTHERETNRADHDANEWRAEGRIKDQAILVELGHIRQASEEIGDTLHNFIAGIQKAAPVKDAEGDEP